jgi:hypothetical protein
MDVGDLFKGRLDESIDRLQSAVDPHALVATPVAQARADESLTPFGHLGISIGRC